MLSCIHNLVYFTSTGGNRVTVVGEKLGMGDEGDTGKTRLGGEP